MAFYTIRVELNYHDENDYNVLHEELYKKGFYRSIMAANGKWYDLPTGLYYGNSDLNNLAVLKIANEAGAKAIADNPKRMDKDWSSFVVKVDGVANFKLPLTFDKKKLPPGVIIQ